jgi:hypothetical protein
VADTPVPHDKSTSLEGRLEDFPLTDILQVLQVSGKSGALFLSRHDAATGIVVFRSGQIVQALASESHQTLGDRLVEKGEVTAAKLHEALGYLARYPGMRLGDALVELGMTTRRTVEEEVKEQMTEAIERMMTWDDAQFVFRIGLVSLTRGMPDFTVDLVLDEGVEPRHILLEASLLQDKRNRELKRIRQSLAEGGTVPPESETLAPAGVPQALAAPATSAPPAKSPPRPAADDETGQMARWFDPAAVPGPQPAEAEKARSAASLLSLTEELFVAQGRGEMGLLLLRYASELYSDGGLVMRDKDAFRLLGQFGRGIGCGPPQDSGPKTHWVAGESPLFDLIVKDGRAYTGLVEPTGPGGLVPVAAPGPGTVPVLAVPLLVLGNVSLILVCQTPLERDSEARALLVLARQVSVTLENLTLREVARRMLA